ncbi:MAG: HNH endonuclease [Clostridiales bacterium]|nr:HNH endonuclease [Clostridiales bacterium]
MSYSIHIKNGRNSTYHSRQYLASQGFKFNHQEKYWGKKTEDWQEVRQWYRYGKKNGFRVTYRDNNFSRSDSYRKDFFAHYRPFYKNRYFCIYCGKLLPKEKIQIDHIVPVHAAETSRAARRLIRSKGWDGVNDYRNLGASCRECNLKKGAHMGAWVFRGRIGKSNKFQVARWCARAGLLVLLAVFAIHIM